MVPPVRSLAPGKYLFLSLSLCLSLYLYLYLYLCYHFVTAALHLCYFVTLFSLYTVLLWPQIRSQSQPFHRTEEAKIHLLPSPELNPGAPKMIMLLSHFPDLHQVLMPVLPGRYLPLLQKTVYCPALPQPEAF